MVIGKGIVPNDPLNAIKSREILILDDDGCYQVGPPSYKTKLD